MTAVFNSIFKPAIRILLILLLVLVSPVPIQAAELKLELKLIWGTNDGTSPDPKHKPVDQATAHKLRQVFKWKNYFLINRQTATIASRSTRNIELSDKCSLEITELQGPSVEVTLIGEGRRVNKTTRHLAKGECFTIGGEDKNGSAWFVLVTELDEK